MTDTLNYRPDLGPSAQEFLPSDTYEVYPQSDSYVTPERLQNTAPISAEQLGRLANMQAATDLGVPSYNRAPEAPQSPDMLHYQGVLGDTLSIVRVREGYRDYDLAA